MNPYSLAEYFGDGRPWSINDSTYVFLEECPSFGNIIFTKEGSHPQLSAFYCDNLSIFPRWGDIISNGDFDYHYLVDKEIHSGIVSHIVYRKQHDRIIEFI